MFACWILSLLWVAQKYHLEIAARSLNGIKFESAKVHDNHNSESLRGRKSGMSALLFYTQVNILFIIRGTNIYKIYHYSDAYVCVCVWERDKSNL